MHILAPYAGLAVKTFGGGRGSQHNDMGIDYERVKFGLSCPRYVRQRQTDLPCDVLRFTTFPVREQIPVFSRDTQSKVFSSDTIIILQT